jgi:hypothetical protein
VVEHLLYKCEGLSSNPSSTKKKKKRICGTQEAETGGSQVQGQPGLHIKTLSSSQSKNQLNKEKESMGGKNRKRKVGERWRSYREDSEPI